jgi:hypothetical protein
MQHARRRARLGHPRRQATGASGPAGYAVERAEFDAAGAEVERYWLRGIKRFAEKDKGLPPGAPVPTAEHPVQGFLWADYTAKAGTHYQFRIVPIFGAVKNPKQDDAAAVTLNVICETEGDLPGAGGGTGIRHDVFFNRRRHSARMRASSGIARSTPPIRARRR